MGMIMTFRDTASTSYYREILMCLLEEYNPDEVVISSAFFFSDFRFLDVRDPKGHSLRDLLEYKSILIGRDNDYFNDLRNELKAVKTFRCDRKANWFENIIVLRKNLSGKMCNVAVAVGESYFTQRDMDRGSFRYYDDEFDYKVDTFYFNNMISPDVSGITSDNTKTGRIDENLSRELAGICDRAEGNGIMMAPDIPDQPKLLDEIYRKLMKRVKDPNMFEEA